MHAQLKRALVLVVGWAFIALGIVGLFLPVLQGILFLLIGLVILSTEYVWAHHLLTKLRQRFPKLGRVADEATATANRWMQHLFRNRRGN
jgi:uncharacterized membrane protein YbaN (DUF454 family)